MHMRRMQQWTAMEEANEFHEKVEQAEEAGLHEGMILDPWGYAPLKFYNCTDKLDQLVDPNWTPPFRLTPRERAVVNQQGATMILGRSGTGKTQCICNRMEQDYQIASVSNTGDGPPCRQLFIARSTRLCQWVQGLQTAMGAGSGTNAKFSPIWQFVDWIDSIVDPGPAEAQRSFDKIHRVDYIRFRDTIWGELQERAGVKRTLTPQTVWTQIRSFIKGRFDWDRSKPHPLLDPLVHLSREKYRALGCTACALVEEDRLEAFEIFEQYQRYCLDHKLWDDCDRQTAILYRYKVGRFRSSPADEPGMPGSELVKLLYDHVYVDEVQDATQLELSLLIIAVVRRDPAALFLAGDPAQSIESGVQFRFEDVREVTDMMNWLIPSPHGRLHKFPKPVKLVDNFRSHAGVLRLASDLLHRMHVFFPGCIPKVHADRGLARGPEPAVVRVNCSDSGADADDGTVDTAEGKQHVPTLSLRKLLLQNPRATVLVREEHKHELRKVIRRCCPEQSIVCLDIRQSKGLEFKDVIVLNFFSGTDCNHWKTLLQTLDAKGGPTDIKRTGHMQDGSRRGGLIMDLKLLHTAVTRCKLRLIFAESAEQDGLGDATRAALGWLVPTKKQRGQQAKVLGSKMLTTTQTLGVSYTQVEGKALTVAEQIERGLELANEAQNAETESDAMDMLEQACGQFKSAKEQDSDIAAAFLVKATRQSRVSKCLYEIKNATTKESEHAAIVRAAKETAHCLEQGFIDFAIQLCAKCADQRESMRWVRDKLAQALSGIE